MKQYLYVHALILIVEAILTPQAFAANVLDLSGSNLDENTLVSLSVHTSLTQLILDNNLFTNIPDLSDVADTLETLNMRYNPIVNFDMNTNTMPFLALENLDLSGCQLTVFPNITFLAKTLFNIYLKDNMIVSVPESHLENSNLKRIYLENNQLTEWPKSFHKFGKNLVILYLDNNPIQNLTTGGIVPSLQLYSLRLRYNSLIWFPQPLYTIVGSSRLAKIEFYESDVTQPRSLPESFLDHDFPRLTFLGFARMKLDKFPPLGYCPKLLEISFHENYITHLPNLVEKYPALEKISLSWNLIVQVSENFVHIFNPFLTIFYIKGGSEFSDHVMRGEYPIMTRFSVISTTLTRITRLGRMPKVTKLVFYKDPIQFVSCDAFDDVPKLAYLQIYNGQIKTIHDVTVRNPFLKTLDLTGNPLTCDCTMYWLKEQEQVYGNVIYGPTLACEDGTLMQNAVIEKCQNESTIPYDSFGLGNLCDPKRSVFLMEQLVTSRFECGTMCFELGGCSRFEVHQLNETFQLCKAFHDACQHDVFQNVRHSVHVQRMVPIG